MTLLPVLSAKFYLVLSHNTIVHCQFPSNLDVTISLHFSSLMVFLTDTFSLQITNCCMTKAYKFIAGNLNCFVCLQHLLPRSEKFHSLSLRGTILPPWQLGRSSGGYYHGRPSLLPLPPWSGRQDGMYYSNWANIVTHPPGQGGLVQKWTHDLSQTNPSSSLAFFLALS